MFFEENTIIFFTEEVNHSSGRDWESYSSNNLDPLRGEDWGGYSPDMVWETEIAAG